jgi:hyperosmotically inducible protein
MHLLKRLLLIATALLFVFSLGPAGCKKEGPAERLGKKLDKAAEKAEKKLDELNEDK